MTENSQRPDETLSFEAGDRAASQLDSQIARARRVVEKYRDLLSGEGDNDEPEGASA